MKIKILLILVLLFLIQISIRCEDKVVSYQDNVLHYCFSAQKGGNELKTKFSKNFLQKIVMKLTKQFDWMLLFKEFLITGLLILTFQFKFIMVQCHWVHS